LMILLAAAMTSFATVLAGLWRYAPAGIPWRLLLAIPGYAVGKVPIYLGFVFGRQREWVRTARRSGTEASPAAAPPGPHHLSASPESSPQRASEYGNHAALG